MLVLSRQQNQRIRLPGLGVSIEIIEIRGSRVRVGIDAPIEVRIVRDELPDKPGAGPVESQQKTFQLPSGLRHDLRNSLNELTLLMHVYKKGAEQRGDGGAESPIDVEQMFEAILSRIRDLSNHRVLRSEAATIEPPKPSCSTERAPCRSALVVDDDRNERELLAGFLRMCEYEVGTAVDGFDALDQIENGRTPDVVLLDMQMPRCDGPAFLSRFRDTGVAESARVFVVSGSDPESLGLQKHAGYVRWFPKPLDPRLVVDELARFEAGASAGA